MSSPAKRKGYLFEAAIRDDLKGEGFNIQRLGQAYQPDFLIDGFGTGEAKCKKNLKGIYDILGSKNFAVVKWQSPQARGKKPIVFMEYDLFKVLLRNLLLDKDV